MAKFKAGDFYATIALRVAEEAVKLNFAGPFAYKDLVAPSAAQTKLALGRKSSNVLTEGKDKQLTARYPATGLPGIVQSDDVLYVVRRSRPSSIPTVLTPVCCVQTAPAAAQLADILLRGDAAREGGELGDRHRLGARGLSCNVHAWLHAQLVRALGELATSAVV